MSDTRPIAVIDSGVGGLTVARELAGILPAEHILYFADTARAPYGPREADAIVGFVRQIVRYLADFQPKHFVLACNTATALALPALRAEFTDLSFSGVIEPTARAAVESAGSKPSPMFAVLATEATIKSRAYERAIARRRNRALVLLRPASLLVPMIEEGRDASDPLVRLALRQYLHPLLARKMDVLVLGCTHFPLLLPAICKIVGERVTVVDASRRCAEDVARRLRSGKIAAGEGTGSLRTIVTDEPARFRQIAKRMLGMQLGDPTLVRIDALPSPRPAQTSTRSARPGNSPRK